MRIVLSVGHHSSAQGAVSTGGVSEWKFWDRAIDDIIARYQGPHTLIKVHRKTQSMPIREINEIAPDWFCECHFNSAANSAATGIEVLHYAKSVKSKTIASLFVKHLSAALGLPLRQGGLGRMPVTAEDRGGSLLEKTRMPGVLIEPFFGSNPNDWQRVQDRYSDMVERMCMAVDDACGVLA